MITGVCMEVDRRRVLSDKKPKEISLRRAGIGSHLA